MNKFDSIQRRPDRILFKFKRTDITISIHSIMAILGWLKFRDICKFRLLCITHKAIYRSCAIHIKESHNSFFSYMYANVALTVAAPKYWNSLPDDLRTIPPLFLSNVDYIHINYHYNVLFYNILLFMYLVIYLFYYINLTPIGTYIYTSIVVNESVNLYINIILLSRLYTAPVYLDEISYI